MIPMPAAKTIKKEKVNIPTRLLAATLSFKVIQKFTDSKTQCSIQKYSVKAKQLALYISGCKCMGGMDRIAKKQKATGDEPEPSTCNKQVIT